MLDLGSRRAACACSLWHVLLLTCYLPLTCSAFLCVLAFLLHMLCCSIFAPSQVQQLILDPAIEHEFQHLRAQLALRVAETEAAKAAYQGSQFTPVRR